MIPLAPVIATTIFTRETSNRLESDASSARISRMVRLGKVFGAAAALLLAGCAAGTRHAKAAHPPDWESGEAKAQHSLTPTAAAPALSLRPPGPAQPSRTNQPSPIWQSLRQWSSDHNLPAPVGTSGAAPPSYSLIASNHLFILNSGKDVAWCDGLEIRLGFPPQVIDGQLFVHSLDLEKNIQPLMANKLPIPAKPQKTIVIDPGHGGEDAGTRGFSGLHPEKYYTLDWGQRLAGLLLADGWQVWLTRTNDTDIILSNRVLFAEVHKADLYISLHFNSAYPDHLQSGIETYCLTPVGMRSTITRGYEDDPALALANNAFDAENLVLACRVHGQLLRASGARDRGIRRARFPGVLRNQQRPAVLVEGGYLSNPSEARQINNPEYRQKLAQAVALALHNDTRLDHATAEEALSSSDNASASPPSSTTAMP